MNQSEFEPEDAPKFLDDKAIRGSMTELWYKTLGVGSANFSFGSPWFGDSHGYFFDNVFGDLSTVGSSQANPSTTGGVLAVGATNMTLAAAPPAAYTAGASLQIGISPTAEVFIISSTAASNVVNFTNNPLRFAHATAQTVQTCGTPFTHKFAALNSPLGYGGAYGAQPPTHTLTDVTNIVSVMTSPTAGTAPSNPYGARQYPSAVLKSLSFNGTVDQLQSVKMAGESWLSVAAGTAVTNVSTDSRPVPNWNGSVVIAGNTVASSGAWSGIGNYTVDFKRTTEVYWTVQGTQTPYIIARGPLMASGSIDWEPTNTETPLDLMLLNSQPPVSITVSNTTPVAIPNTGTPFTMTFTMSQAAMIKSKIMGNKALIGYSTQYEAVSNLTDVGGSAGQGPGTITLTNNTATY
jgi:hypothetical protein